VNNTSQYRSYRTSSRREEGSLFWGPLNSWAEENYFIIFGDVLVEKREQYVLQMVHSFPLAVLTSL